MQEARNRLKRVKSQQTNNKKTKFYFDSTHTITISIRRLYLYKSYICDLFKSRYKTLINRNETLNLKREYC